MAAAPPQTAAPGTDARVTLRGERGRFLPGNKPGPGRTPGIPEFETSLRRMLAEGSERFAEVFEQLLLDGDPKAWGLALERAYPKPREAVDITSDGGPVSFSWRAPDAEIVDVTPPNIGDTEACSTEDDTPNIEASNADTEACSTEVEDEQS